MSVISADDLKRFQDKMNRMMEEFGFDTREEQKRVQQMLGNLVDFDVPVPSADMMDTDEAVVLTVDLPGVQKKDIEISISSDVLRLTAKREIPEGDYRMQERKRTFERRFPLPAAVIGDETKARMENGVLQITIPREVPARKRITIE